ncbi:MAG TPA: TetR/AcrR family transcriptional regulator [Polyangiaceae bacterium]|nr:TetR/AcrR family transcriptional regulator [Polyangiaceae bacterium]
MPRSKRPALAPRKQPVQARSSELVASLLEAAVRVLSREGAARFTTIRVAETAGVSVGSLYQYFPNKQAILFRLQQDEWEKTGAAIDTLLGDTSRAPAERLRATMRAFFQSECDEAPLRLALDAATPNYHDAPESKAHRRRSRSVVRAFVAAAAPRASPSQRRFAADLLFMTMTAIGKQVSERRPTEAEARRWADATAAMVTGYLAQLSPGD